MNEREPHEADSADTTPPTPDDTDFTHAIAVIKAQRSALLDARDDGAIDAEALTAALLNLDAEQLTRELRQ